MMMEDSDEDIFYDTTDVSDTSESPPVPPHVDSDNPSPTNSSRYSSTLSLKSSNAHSISSDDSDYADVEDHNDSEDLNVCEKVSYSDNFDESDDAGESDVDDDSSGDYVLDDGTDVADDDTDESTSDDAYDALPPLLKLPWPVSMVSSASSLPTGQDISFGDSDQKEDLPASSVSRKKPSQNNPKPCYDYEKEFDRIVEAISKDEVAMLKEKLKNAKNNKTDLFEGSVVNEK